jgi:ABC-2 type transport system ATP-binding protein
MARNAASTRNRTAGGSTAEETTADASTVRETTADGSTEDPALVVDGVSKRYGTGEGSVLAVDDVSLTVERGAVVGLLGPNGAGKTTLIKSILGTVLPDAGTIRLFGTDVRADPRVAYADVDAMLEGARNDYWRLTVRENLRYFATIGGVDPDSVAARHDHLLNRLGLAADADTPVRDLSRGMKQKVSLASVLAGGASLVFLDEPTLGLDVESARVLRREIRRLAREEGLTVLLSTHDMPTVEAVCDRVVLLADGHIVADDAPDALLSAAGRGVTRIASPDLDRSVVAALRDRFAVEFVERSTASASEGRSVVEVDASGDNLYALLDVLREHGVTPSEVRTVTPDLEDVFLDITDGGQSR